MAMDQQETFNWLVNERRRILAQIEALTTSRDLWIDRCVEIALRAAQNNPVLQAEIERCRKADDPDPEVFDLILRAVNPAAEKDGGHGMA